MPPGHATLGAYVGEGGASRCLRPSRPPGDGDWRRNAPISAFIAVVVGAMAFLGGWIGAHFSQIGNDPSSRQVGQSAGPGEESHHAVRAGLLPKWSGPAAPRRCLVVPSSRSWPEYPRHTGVLGDARYASAPPIVVEHRWPGLRRVRYCPKGRVSGWGGGDAYWRAYREIARYKGVWCRRMAHGIARSRRISRRRPRPPRHRPRRTRCRPCWRSCQRACQPYTFSRSGRAPRPR